MTVPGDEQAQAGSGEFRDVVDVQLLDEALLVAARIARAPSAGSASVTALVIVDGEPVVEVAEEVAAGVDSWERAVAGPLRLTIEQPLERWSLSLDAPGARIELELHALSAPAELADPATAAAGRAAGLQRYAQLCVARGTAEIGGRRRTVDAPAVRAHRWGSLAETSRARFLTVASEDGELLTVAAVQPPGAQAHGEELVGGHTTRAGDGGGDGPLPFETGAPVDGVRRGRDAVEGGRRAVPARGRAAQPAFRGGGRRHRRSDFPAIRSSLTLFRFSFDGVPALGSYEMEAGA